MIGFVPLPQRRQAPVMVTAFGGLDRNPDAVLGAWASELNLSSERAPRMSVRKNRVPVDGIDGNETGCGVIAACGELDRIALLDEYGRLWSGGNSLWLLDGGYSASTSMGALIVVDDAEMAANYFGDGDTSAEVVAGEHRLVYHDNEGAPFFAEEGASHTYPVSADLSNIGMHVAPGVSIRWSEGAALTVTLCFDNRQMIAMGSNVIVMPDKKFANAVKLASGAPMIEGEDYGGIDAEATERYLPAAGVPNPAVTLTLCDKDGKPYTGAATAKPETPEDGDLWIDTMDGDKLMRFRDGDWTQIPSTYVSVGFSVTNPGGSFAVGDGVEITAEFGALDVPDDARAFLSGSKIIEAITEDNKPVFSGIISQDAITVALGATTMTPTYVRLSRTMPIMDYVVESGNRLWGCRYGKNESGEVVNEIYASALGSFTNWRRYDNLSVSSYAASRGTDGAFTGAAVLDGHPLFFRAGSVEKVFPSASGAHQISTQTLDGVEPGSDKSLCIIDNVLYYKSRRGVMAYTGTLPRLVSGALGSERYSAGVFGRDGKRLYCSMLPEQGEREIYVYDTERGEWHREDGTPELSMTVWRDALYMLISGQLVKASGGEDSRGVRWEAETPEIGLDVLGRKWISHVQLFCRMELGASASVFVSYDGGGWHRKGWISGNRMGTQTIEVYPHRCERLRLRLEGVGGFELVRLAYRVEEGGDRP